MVIDDLADRSLDCKILLDQNMGASEVAYKGKVLSDCKYLIGPKYALLRKEFQDWRQYSLNRRLRGSIQKILITMGGVDASNHTLEVIKELERSEYSADCEFTIVLGALFPHIHALEKFIKSSQLVLSVMTNVKNMAEIMSKSDLCIGAAGSTSWERCCLGLPTLTFVLAENQKTIALALDEKGAAISSNINQLRSDFEFFFESNNNALDKLMHNSKDVCDGLGASRVIDHMEYLNEN
jgi:UDP-2,4-diacetamido-2,4,6-trideoxy-beta-L-altropyranose hydrolase